MGFIIIKSVRWLGRQTEIKGEGRGKLPWKEPWTQKSMVTVIITALRETNTRRAVIEKWKQKLKSSAGIHITAAEGWEQKRKGGGKEGKGEARGWSAEWHESAQGEPWRSCPGRHSTFNPAARERRGNPQDNFEKRDLQIYLRKSTYYPQHSHTGFS